MSCPNPPVLRTLHGSHVTWRRNQSPHHGPQGPARSTRHHPALTSSCCHPGWLGSSQPHRPPHAPSAAHQQSHTHCLVWFPVVFFFFFPFHLFPSSLAHFLCAGHHADHSTCISPFNPHTSLRRCQYYYYPCSIKEETEAQRGVLVCPKSPSWEMAELGFEPHAGWSPNTEPLSCQLIKGAELRRVCHSPWPLPRTPGPPHNSFRLCIVKYIERHPDHVQQDASIPLNPVFITTIDHTPCWGHYKSPFIL